MSLVKLILSTIGFGLFCFLSMKGFYISFVWLMNHIGLADTIISFLSVAATLYAAHIVERNY